jgi:hypothetical protein
LYIRGWDTTIALSSGAGKASIIDDFNGLEIMQIIANPNNESMIYTIDILNTDFNLVVFERVCQGKFNELLSLPCYGHNSVRISNSNPSSGSVIVAVRFRVPR